MIDAEPGEKCSNGPDVECWTCPNCYHDHDSKVIACAECKVALVCTIKRPPIAVCMIAYPDQADDEDEEA